MPQIESSTIPDCSKYLNMCRDRESVVLTGIPMSPSSNNQYSLIRRGAKTFHVPSSELVAFKGKMERYPQSCPDLFIASRHMVQGWVQAGKHLEFRSVFFFHHHRIFTQAGKPKRLDTSNRIKALHDSMSKLLQVDDSIFFKVVAEKALCHDDLQEMCCIEILPL